MFSEHFRIIIHSQSFPISKKTVLNLIFTFQVTANNLRMFAMCFRLSQIMTDAMPIEFRLKICLFREQSEQQSAKWDRGFK